MAHSKQWILDPASLEAIDVEGGRDLTFRPSSSRPVFLPHSQPSSHSEDQRSDKIRQKCKFPKKKHFNLDKSIPLTIFALPPLPRQEFPVRNGISKISTNPLIRNGHANMDSAMEPLSRLQISRHSSFPKDQPRSPRPKRRLTVTVSELGKLRSGSFGAGGEVPASLQAAFRSVLSFHMLQICALCLNFVLLYVAAFSENKIISYFNPDAMHRRCFLFSQWSYMNDTECLTLIKVLKIGANGNFTGFSRCLDPKRTFWAKHEACSGTLYSLAMGGTVAFLLFWIFILVPPKKDRFKPGQRTSASRLIPVAFVLAGLFSLSSIIAAVFSLTGIHYWCSLVPRDNLIKHCQDVDKVYAGPRAPPLRFRFENYIIIFQVTAMSGGVVWSLNFLLCLRRLSTGMDFPEFFISPSTSFPKIPSLLPILSTIDTTRPSTTWYRSNSWQGRVDRNQEDEIVGKRDLPPKIFSPSQDPLLFTPQMKRKSYVTRNASFGGRVLPELEFDDIDPSNLAKEKKSAVFNEDVKLEFINKSEFPPEAKTLGQFLSTGEKSMGTGRNFLNQSMRLALDNPTGTSLSFHRPSPAAVGRGSPPTVRNKPSFGNVKRSASFGANYDGKPMELRPRKASPVFYLGGAKLGPGEVEAAPTDKPLSIPVPTSGLSFVSFPPKSLRMSTPLRILAQYSEDEPSSSNHVEITRF